MQARQGLRARKGEHSGVLPAAGVRRLEHRVASPTSVLSFGLLLTSLLLTSLLGGCISGEPETEPPAELQKYVVDSVPDGVERVDADFGGKITLEGVEVSPKGEVPPGGRVTLKMYWRVKQALGESGWRLFTHVLDASGDRLLNIDNVGPLRRMRRNGQAWPPSRWLEGKVYVDTQSFTMPRRVRSKTIQVVTGIWKGKSRQKLVAGPSAGKNRALVATIETGEASRRKNQRVPRLRAVKLSEGQRISIDGKLDEDAWKTAASTGAFVSVKSGEPDEKSPVQGEVKLTWDAEHLYLGFDVEDSSVVGGFDPKQKDPHLWTKDCVEIMVDPDPSGDNQDYYEIQINPQNLVFDSQFDDYNQPRKEPDGPFGHEEWSARLKSAVSVRGTLDQAGDEDSGYVVEVQIPWASFDKAKSLPPEDNSTWRMNFYAMQDNGGVAWSPILGQGNFHKASRFGRVTWATQASPTRPAAAKPGEPSVQKSSLEPVSLEQPAASPK